MKTYGQFVMAVAGLTLAIMIINPNNAFADKRPKATAAVTQTCGNGVKEGTEECDDGNVVADDGCSAVCEIEAAQPPAGPMQVERIEADHLETGTMNAGELNAGPVTTPRVEAGHVEVDTANVGTVNVGQSRTAQEHVGHMDVGELTVAGNRPVHSLALMFSYGSGMGDPWMAQGIARYAVRWNLVGVSVAAGAGGWEKYGEASGSPMLTLNPSFIIGNDEGGGELGVQVSPLGPLGSGEGWENLVMVKLGGWWQTPAKGSDGFILRPWLGIPVYEPKNSSSPSFDPKFLLGLDLGWVHQWLP